MSAEIALPAEIGEFALLESTPERAATFATNLRAVGVGVKNVQGWASASGAPGWAGDTREAHDHARTRFGVRLDSAEAALERAVTATDRFAERLSRQQRRRALLEADRVDLNAAIAALRAEIVASADVVPPPTDTRLAELRRRAAQLRARADGLRGDITDWIARRDDAEADYIAALGRVDTGAEGEDAATAPGRVDVAALTRALSRVLDDPPAVALWWAGLTRAQRQALMLEHPALVGNAGGIPTRDRDEANRAALYHDLDHLGQRDPDELTERQQRVLENAEAVHEQIDRYRGQLDPMTGEELLQLIVYDPGAHGGDGGVAIGFGDPDSADHVSVTVPGLTTEMTNLEDSIGYLNDLFVEANSNENGSVAAIYWGDYDAPSGSGLDLLDYLGVTTDGRADAGGDRLADFIDGLRAADEGESAHVTAIGHSYGSTTLGHALDDGLAVDEAVLLGSPGVPDDTAGGLTGADVWVGSMDHDPVTLLGDRGLLDLPGGLGHDPADVGFGGTRFDTGDGSSAIQDLLDNHQSYFEDRSLDNIAHIVAGNEDAVTEQPHRGDRGGDYLTLDQLLAHGTLTGTAAAVEDWARDLVRGLAGDLSRPGGVRP